METGKCEQCGKTLENDLLTMFTKHQVCKSCVKKNHKKITGGKK